MEDSMARNALILKVEYHRQLADALREDSTSKSQHILSPEDHKKAQAISQEDSIKSALRMAADYHRKKHEYYLKELQARFPNENYDAIYEKNENWMVEEIWDNAEPFEDPVLESKEDAPEKEP